MPGSLVGDVDRRPREAVPFGPLRAHHATTPGFQLPRGPELAFDRADLQAAAKGGILGASVVATAVGLLVLRRAGGRSAEE